MSGFKRPKCSLAIMLTKKINIKIEKMTKSKQFSIKPTVFLLFLVVSTFELMGQTSSIPTINQKQEHI